MDRTFDIVFNPEQNFKNNQLFYYHQPYLGSPKPKLYRKKLCIYSVNRRKAKNVFGVTMLEPFSIIEKCFINTYLFVTTAMSFTLQKHLEKEKSFLAFLCLSRVSIFAFCHFVLLTSLALRRRFRLIAHGVISICFIVFFFMSFSKFVL